MFKIRIYKTLIFLSLISIPLVFSKITLATTASPSAIPEEEIIDNIKERLEEVVDDKEKIDTISEDLTNKNYAWVGTISEISENNITIQTLEGKKQGTLTSETTILRLVKKKSEEIKPEDLEIDEYIIAMGPKSTDNTITVKRLLAAEEPESIPEKKVIWGKVSEIDNKKITLKNNGESTTITISNKTTIKISETEEPTLEDIQLEDKLYAVVTLDENNAISQVDKILIIPGLINPQAKENEVGTTPSPKDYESTPSTEEEN